MRMDSKKVRTDDAVERLAAISEEHLRGLSPEERANRLLDFHQVVVKVVASSANERPAAKREKAAK